MKIIRLILIISEFIFIQCNDREIIHKYDYSSAPVGIKGNLLVEFDSSRFGKMLESGVITYFCTSSQLNDLEKSCSDNPIATAIELNSEKRLNLALDIGTYQYALLAFKSRNFIFNRADANIYFSDQLANNDRTCKMAGMEEDGWFAIVKIFCPSLKIQKDKITQVIISPMRDTYFDFFWTLRPSFLYLIYPVKSNSFLTEVIMKD